MRDIGRLNLETDGAGIVRLTIENQNFEQVAFGALPRDWVDHIAQDKWTVTTNLYEKREEVP